MTFWCHRLSSLLEPTADSRYEFGRLVEPRPGRVQRIGGNELEVAGRLLDMEDMDRGMLGLYLSTQPLAA